MALWHDQDWRINKIDDYTECIATKIENLEDKHNLTKEQAIEVFKLALIMQDGDNKDEQRVGIAKEFISILNTLNLKTIEV